ncbi:MAG TPA: xanthine dehydrogenase family protein molybdopterin-binding subunit [Methylomirabilota bacterium]|nr:xanthine dehydrogenase family protein molybdopterin-binding subunit [Methylomirabilota bacterium]
MNVVGRSLKRKEDRALVAGRGRYLDDFTLPDMLHVGVVRSTHAHARLGKVTVDEALAGPGVVAAFTAGDLPELSEPIPAYGQLKNFRDYAQPVLARDKVRYVGEPIAALVADTPYRLADALARVTVEYEDLPVITSTESALGSAARIHEAWPDNLAGVSQRIIGEPEAAMRAADVIVHERLYHARSAGMPIEPRGVVAYEDRLTGALVVITSTQTTYLVRGAIAHVLGLPVERVRVLAPDVGGGFGAKAQTYAEEILVPALARRLQRPVKWMERRREHFLATCHDREQTHEVRVGFRHDGTIVAIDGTFQADFGAYTIQDDAAILNTIVHLCSPYRVAHYRSVCQNLVTNKTYSAAYRGAGRPEAAFVMERLLDIAARRLGLDPADIRRRNLIRAAEMPYRPGLPYKDGVDIVYDPGDFLAAFERALELIGYREHRARPARPAGPRRIGVGVACYHQGTALGPYEGANVRVDPSGQVYVFVGFSSQGQGHATTFAQIAAQELGAPFDAVTIVGADTAALPYGFGALASRLAANAGPAVARAAREARRRATLVAATMLECAPEDLVSENGRLHVVGLPERSVALGEVARAAAKGKVLAPTGEAGLNTCAYFYPKTVTWAFGAQAAAVEVDVETGAVRLLRYVAVHDSGRPINPMIVEGQLHGGVAQGVGAALMEELVYDAGGQLVTGSFMDYALPRADDLPEITTALLDHPSIINELGIKGAGESGAIAPGPAIANAIEDALAPFGITIRELPVTPARIFEMLREAR